MFSTSIKNSSRNAGPNGRRSSIVPTMAQVVIDTSLPAPRSTMHSLDFDRVVNAYSVMSVKKRLVNHHNQQQQQQRSSVQQRHASQQMKELVQSYRVFQSQAQSHHDHDNLLHSPNGKKYAQWGLTIALGLICGGVACLLIYCTSHITSFRTERLNWQLQLATGVLDEATFEERYHYKSFANKLAHYVGIPVATKYGTYAIMIEFTIYNAALALMSAFLCIFFAPNAVGSGIPEVKAYLNGVCVESFADLPVFLTKIVGTICSVSSGLIVGPEGPLVHIGAIVGQGITKTTSMEMALRRFRARRPNVAKLCGCGSADDGGLEEDVYMEEKYDKVLLAALAEGDSQDEEDDDDDDDFDDENGVSNEEDGLLSSLRLHDLEKVPDGRTYQSTGAYNRKQPRMDPPTQMQEETPTHCPKANHTFLTESMAVLSRFRNDGDRRDLISIGVATGFAAAFGAPVGGLLYSFEEASSFFTIPLMWRTLVATAIGTFVIAVYHGDLSQFSVLSLGDGSELAEYHHVFSSFAELPFYVLIGAAGGLLGAFFNACYIHNNTVRAKFYAHSDIRYKSFYRMLEVLIVSVLTSLATFCLSVYIPQSWACTDIKEGYGGDGDGESRYNCPVGQFNEIASILLGSRDDALNDILTDPSKFEPRTLLMTGLCCLFLMIITFGIFIPSGLFMPTLLTGSTLSGWAGLMLKRYVWSSIVPEHFALVGATAMLAGVQRTTVSLCVIMMEATGQTKVLIPLIIAVVVARYVADFFNDGFYHINMHMKHFPFLEHQIRETFDICTVSDVMTSPVVTLKGVEEAGDIEQILRQHKNKAFPVLDQDTDQYVGLIRRDQLAALLECGIYLESLEEQHGNHRESIRVKAVLNRAKSEHIDRALLSDADAYSKEGCGSLKRSSEWLNDNVTRSDHGQSVIISTDETLPSGNTTISRPRGTVVDMDDDGNIIVHVCREERYFNVDISAAMNRGAYTVMQNCPLSKAYNLFTAMGLRHLPILGRDGSVVGIVTRSNFNPKYMERRTGLDMHH